jgi:hypothetical protein
MKKHKKSKFIRAKTILFALAFIAIFSFSGCKDPKKNSQLQEISTASDTA